MVWIVLAIYVLCLLFIFAYSLVQLSLVMNYRRYRIQHDAQPDRVYAYDHSDLPRVTIQLPVYNERYVVERLIDSVCALQYPKDRLQIQVLDDSTDDSKDMAAARIAHWRQEGLDIEHVFRPDRKGFKAGALAYGLQQATGDFIAIFDADFVPDPDFLVRTLPPFEDDNVGMVQTRWEHLNRDYSLLTRLQAFALDAHFSVEQGGRNAGGHFINFNGTAGVWRKTAIAGAGGWSDDTLTEDLDLSYRAQLKGWRFVFLESTGSPAELPAVMSALKTQQFRWNKGAAECARKNLGKVMRDKSLPLGTKVHAFFHLMNSGIFIAVMGCVLLSVPVLWIKHSNPMVDALFPVGSVFLISLLILAVFYYRAIQRQHLRGVKANFALTFLLFLSMSMGLAFHNGLAVLEGYAGRKSPFLRTPKQGMRTRNDGWVGKAYLESVLNPQTLVEVLLALYFAGAIALSFYLGDFALLPLFILLFAGFGGVSGYSVWHSVGR